MASFCKLMFDDNHTTSKLQIPPEFVKNYGHILESSKMIRLTSDDQSGKVWRVGIKKTGDFHFFTKGWTNFAKDVNLQKHDFVIFKLVDESEFHVWVYDTTGCDKPFSYSDDGLKNGKPGSNAERRWEFSREVKEHHLHTCRMDFPKEFIVGTGIVEKEEIKLEDGKGRKWPVKVTSKNGRTYGMTGGWKDFVVANGGVIGSIVSYKFVSGDLVRALVINHNATPKQH